MTKETLKRIGNVILFFLLWFGLPMYMNYRGASEEVYLILAVSWVPAMFIMIYITDSDV